MHRINFDFYAFTNHLFGFTFCKEHSIDKLCNPNRSTNRTACSPIETIVVAPSALHVWIPGYYVYRRQGYVWMPRTYRVAPRGYHTWTPGYWRQGPRGHVWVEGRWR